MAVLVDENTKVICQGLTGSDGMTRVDTGDFEGGSKNNTEVVRS